MGLLNPAKVTLEGSTPSVSAIPIRQLTLMSYFRRLAMEMLLYLIAVVLFVYGIVKIVQRDFLFGTILILVAFLVGPGGVSLLL
jgi:hypothetical protein